MKKETKILIIVAIILIGGFFIYAGNNWFKQKNIPNSQNQNQATKQTGKVKGESNKTQPSESDNINDLPTPTQTQNYNIPILMYHYIRDFNDPNDQVGTNLSVSPQKFEEQLKWLKDNGYQTVDFKYLANRSFDPTGAQDQNHMYVILTFDDGYEDTYTNALPILKKYEFTATFYIIINYVGKDGYMSWQQINELKNSGMNIGSHTLSHPDLAKATDSKMEKEISQSKKILEEKNGATISDFCYPSGKYDNRTIEALKKYGFQTATTTKSGIFDSEKNNPLEIPRYRITTQTELNKILH